MSRKLNTFLFGIVVSLFTPGLLIAQTVMSSFSRIVEVNVPAPALADNLLQTPTVQSAAVYLPPSYDSEPDRRYPVIYMLHGIFDNYNVWIENYSVPSILDRLIASRDTL